MSAHLIFDVAVAITRGSVLMAVAYSVGTYRFATDPAEVQRYVCLDLQGTPIPFSEEWDEAYLDRGKVRFVEAYEDDWSAFSAAFAFVALAGEPAARAAIERTQDAVAAE